MWGGVGGRWRDAVRWTLLMLLAGLLVAAIALAGLANDQQVCLRDASFPCPTGEDQRVGLLTLAFFGVPALWLAGIAVLALLRQRRS